MRSPPRQDGNPSRWKVNDMRKELLAFVGIVVVCGLGSGPTAFAHEGHASCKPGATYYNPSRGASADIVKLYARTGDMGTFEESLHQDPALCEPR